MKIHIHNRSILGYTRQLLALFDFDSRYWLNMIDVPTLVVGSDEDRVATFEGTQGLAVSIPNAKLVMVSAGLVSQVEHPKKFVNYLNDFYNNLEI